MAKTYAVIHFEIGLPGDEPEDIDLAMEALREDLEDFMEHWNWRVEDIILKKA